MRTSRLTATLPGATDTTKRPCGPRGATIATLATRTPHLPGQFAGLPGAAHKGTQIGLEVKLGGSPWPADTATRTIDHAAAPRGCLPSQ
eukprot:7315450-Pyramimonas_sp.AAC.1